MPAEVVTMLADSNDDLVFKCGAYNNNLGW